MSRESFISTRQREGETEKKKKKDKDKKEEREKLVGEVRVFSRELFADD